MIPELGVRIDPGPACEGFVSNVEGVLERITGVIEGVIACGDETERETGEKFLKSIASVKTGVLPVTLIIDDPSGNSAIISEKTRKLPYPDEEDNEVPGGRFGRSGRIISEIFANCLFLRFFSEHYRRYFIIQLYPQYLDFLDSRAPKREKEKNEGPGIRSGSDPNCNSLILRMPILYQVCWLIRNM